MYQNGSKCGILTRSYVTKLTGKPLTYSKQGPFLAELALEVGCLHQYTKLHNLPLKHVVADYLLEGSSYKSSGLLMDFDKKYIPTSCTDYKIKDMGLHNPQTALRRLER
jgi:hypothetical protein